MGITLQIDPATTAWRPDDATLAKIGRIVSDDTNVTVRIWPRSLIGQVTGRAYLEPYAFRARNVGGTMIDLFADRTETRESVAWLLAHELAHSRLAAFPEVRHELQQARPRSDPASDHFHKVDPEERYCDGIATRIVGARLDREWWRKRVEASR
jgi:hypothetical protein